MEITQLFQSTVEPPKKGHFGGRAFVPCGKVFPLWEIFSQTHIFSLTITVIIACRRATLQMLEHHKCYHEIESFRDSTGSYEHGSLH